MGFLSNVRQAVSNAKGGVVDLSSLTPEQRAAYDARMAEVTQAQAESQASYEHAKAISEQARAGHVLQGPAGDALYGPAMAGPSPAELEQIRQDQGMRAMIAASMAPQKGEFTKALRQTVGRDGPKEIDDPDERAGVAAAERAERDAARAPYRAATPWPLTISRIAARGRSQIDEVLAFLGRSGLAARPDLVFGLYRVPDRISPTLTPHSEAGRVVEWDVVHVPGPLAPSDVALTVATLAAGERWVARRVGEPSIADEELGALYCAGAGIAPERCLGIARQVHLYAPRWGQGGDEDSASLLYTVVDGVQVVHPALGHGDPLAAMRAAAPLAATDAEMASMHLAILDWEEVARVVHPQAQRGPRVPSPFPYLPSTPQEVLRAYVEVVGVAASDCWSAQVTVARAQVLRGTFRHGGEVNIGPKLPGADGTARMRLHGAQKVVIAYRDRPAYADGRARWAAYQRDVLQANLDVGSAHRVPVQTEGHDDIANPLLRAGARVADVVDRVVDSGLARPPSPYRYCWPPVG